MRKLLVAVDGSENAFRALDYATSLAQYGAAITIHLIYVYEDVSYGHRSHAFHSNEELARPSRERGEAVLNASASRVTASGVQVVPVLSAGDVAETVVSHAETLGCDSIVMGMKGQNLLSELVLGSTAMTVLHATKLPVTLVK